MTLNIWNRDDGFCFDRIVLTKDPLFDPDKDTDDKERRVREIGPPESKVQMIL